MKSFTCLLIALTAMTLGSCKKEADSIKGKSASLNKCQSYGGNENILNCCLEAIIADSRCPVDAVCIWQGAAVGRFSVHTAGSNYTITLSTTRFGEYKPDATVEGFKIELISLSPQKEAGKPIAGGDYVAELKITKL
ncbi:MAG: hypothetical protein ABIQ31_20030 [Ferruginibacter sp.]